LFTEEDMENNIEEQHEAPAEPQEPQHLQSFGNNSEGDKKNQEKEEPQPKIQNKEQIEQKPEPEKVVQNEEVKNRR
jgi:hypothetical protein